mmetsp:Transcript_17359/g.53621  ORF Transcript_17359/g.53621 Transcript_17359/m.53621 type:complete len:221 (-) Transcript_17359:539-1201(-)
MSSTTGAARRPRPSQRGGRPGSRRSQCPPSRRARSSWAALGSSSRPWPRRSSRPPTLRARSSARRASRRTPCSSSSGALRRCRAGRGHPSAAYPPGRRWARSRCWASSTRGPPRCAQCALAACWKCLRRHCGARWPKRARSPSATPSIASSKAATAKLPLACHSACWRSVLPGTTSACAPSRCRRSSSASGWARSGSRWQTPTPVARTLQSSPRVGHCWR